MAKRLTGQNWYTSRKCLEDCQVAKVSTGKFSNDIQAKLKDHLARVLFKAYTSFVAYPFQTVHLQDWSFRERPFVWSSILLKDYQTFLGGSFLGIVQSLILQELFDYLRGNCFDGQDLSPELLKQLAVTRFQTKEVFCVANWRAKISDRALLFSWIRFSWWRTSSWWCSQLWSSSIRTARSKLIYIQEWRLPGRKNVP